MKRLLLTPILAAALSWPAVSSAQGPVKTPRVHALTNARIITAPGSVIENGVIVIRNGVIEAVGANTAPPDDARIWDLDSAWVYPGLIDLAMTVSLPKEEEEDDGDARETLEHELWAVRAHASMADGFLLKDSDRTSRRSAGITTARVFPDDGVFRGRAAVLNLGDGGLGENLVKADAGQVMSFKRASSGYPRSTMGVTAVIRQTLADADWYRRAHAAYKSNPRGLERPEFNAALEALTPAVEGVEPLIFVTADVLDLIRAQELAREFDLTLDFVCSGEEYKRLEALPEEQSALVVPVSFPKAPDVGKTDGEALQVSLEQLRRWDMAPDNPVRIYESDREFAFTALGLKDTGKFRENIAKVVDAGLPREAALAACTTIPARMAGIDNQCGRIEAGLAANLVVVDGELFSDSTAVTSVWIDGRVFEIEEQEPPEGDPRGLWDFTALVDGSVEVPGKLRIEGEIGSLTGEILSGPNSIPATCTQSGRTVTLIFDGTAFGAPGLIRWSMHFVEDSGSGSGTYPGGTFTVTATRIESYSDKDSPGKGERR